MSYSLPLMPISASLALALVLPCLSPVHAQDISDLKIVTASQGVDRIFAGGVPRSITDLKAMESRQQQIVKQTTPCVVAVQVGQAQGSGVIISADGYVLTAAHVAAEPDLDVKFMLADGRLVKGKTLGMYMNVDAGLAKIDRYTSGGKAVTWPHVEMGNSQTVIGGQWVLAMGHPGGFEPGRPPVVRLGRVLENHRNLIKTDCKLVGGDSGGPLFDMQGRVIGVHSRIGNSLFNNIHVPIQAYRDNWDKLVKGDQWGYLPGSKPFIGVKGSRKSNEAVITHVYPGAPAERAGIRVGDVVTKFDDEPVDDFYSLRRLVDAKHPGDFVNVQVKRGMEVVQLRLKIGNLGV